MPRPARHPPRISTPDTHSEPQDTGCTDETDTDQLNSQCSTFQSCSAENERLDTERMDETNPPQMLLRKEVIQPHLPVRLPCYDLVLIASPTLDGSPLKRLGHRLRVLPTFMT